MNEYDRRRNEADRRYRVLSEVEDILDDRSIDDAKKVRDLKVMIVRWLGEERDA